MVQHNTAEHILSATGNRLRRGETAQSYLMLVAGSKEQRTSNESWFVLTNQRLFHIPGAGTEAQIQSASLENVGTAEVAKRPRYHGFLLPAGYFFVIGVSFLIATAVAGAFQGIVLVPTLLLGGGFLAIWWYSGGETVIRVELGDTQLEGLVGSAGQREASDFVDSLLELQGKAQSTLPG